MDYSALLADLHRDAPLIGPSLLACDFVNLGDEIRRVEEAGARLLHLDVMDGHFVPNLSIGLPVVEAVRRASSLPLDVHLMISEPGRYLKPFREAGADLITIHIEVAPQPERLLGEIHALGAGAGLSLNPTTPVAAIEPYLDHVDLVLVMSVMPGFGGQQFDPAALDKLRRIRELAGSKVFLSVDGGVNGDSIAQCAEAGADLFVAGTGLFSHEDYTQRLAELTELARSSKDAKV